MKRLIALTAAALGAVPGAAAPAPSEQDIAAFEAAMAKGDVRAAVTALDPIIDARRQTSGAPRPDPLLSALVGRVVIEGAPAIAEAYLGYAQGPDLPPRQRALARMALAEARETTGRTGAALQAIEGIEAAALSADEQRDFALRKARLLLTRDPAAALASAVTLAHSPGPRSWEAELISAQASSLLGDAAAAASAAGRAWAAAGDAPARDFAPMRVAAVRASLAAVRGDREASLAMLTAAGASHGKVDQRVAELLPMCGDGGLVPDDQATFAVFAPVTGAARLMPVSASRPVVALRFLEALGGAQLLGGEREGPSGTTVTVRCRPYPSTAFDPPLRGPEPLADWFAAHGFFPSLNEASGDDFINALSRDVERLEKELGPDHPSLIPVRYRLANALYQRAGAVGDVEEWQITRLLSQVRAGITRLGGPVNLMESEEEKREARAIAAATTPEEGLRLGRAAAVKRLAGSGSVDAAYHFMIDWFRTDTELPEALKRSAAEAVEKRLTDPGDPRRRTAEMILARLDAERDVASAQRRWRALGLAPDLCVASAAEPTVKEHPFSSDQYPSHALAYALEGASVFDLTIDAEGRVTAGRVILSAPAGMFDEAIAAGLPKMRLTPAMRQGKPRGCRGFTQKIVWRMPATIGEEAFPKMPEFRKPEEKDGT